MNDEAERAEKGTPITAAESRPGFSDFENTKVCHCLEQAVPEAAERGEEASDGVVALAELSEQSATGFASA